MTYFPCEICKNNGFVKTNWQCKSCKTLNNKEYYNRPEIKEKKSLSYQSRIIDLEFKIYKNLIERQRYEKNKNDPNFKIKRNLKSKIRSSISINKFKKAIYDKKRNNKPENKAKLILKNKIRYEKEKNNQELKNKKNIQNMIYYEKNKNTKDYKNKKRLRENKRWREDFLYKLRKTISAAVNRALISNNCNKNKISILKYLPYTIEELKIHIENQFKIFGNEWMNWTNQGIYNKNIWNNNDTNTWKWQLDHIIPQSTLPYSSMEDENFKKCWALENLRPLSAKQNLLDGCRKSQSI